MNIIESIAAVSLKEKTVVTIGTFDGVHPGHQKILDKMKLQAQILKVPTLLLTFFPHPRMVLQQDAGLKLINTMAEKMDLLAEKGLDYLVIQQFDKSFSRMSPEAYVEEILVNKFNATLVVIGYDHRFGRNRSADINTLRNFGAKMGFEVLEISKEEVNEVTISSTKIRKAIAQGEIVQANTLLGYEYFVTGTVIKGFARGRTLGFPTANIFIEENYKLLPKNGVYIVESIIDDVLCEGVLNIGTNPTFNGADKSIEVFFIDKDFDLYGKKLKLRFKKRIRDELKFDKVTDLVLAMKQDVQKAKEFFLN
ncbi:MAG: bifunctional riboflavin kinase/FAD synthetase [Flavobacteriaceae bacterium]|nr:bifunctional riboflavin kinase/FAD synthetase [Flavobacteriaceae bacterium]